MTKGNGAPMDLASAGKLMRRASYASVAVASVLIGAKFSVGIYTGSVAILSSLMDSVLDLVASTVTLVAIHQATQPADRQHRFGHGKAEAIAGLMQSAIIAGSAAFILFEAAARLLDIKPIAHPEAGIAVIAGSIALTLILVLYQNHVVRQTGSMAVSADSVHYRGDILTNLSVIMALVLAGYMDIPYADPFIAVGVAAYLVWNAWDILSVALNVLMDRELPSEHRQEIVDVVMSHRLVVGVHDLRTRSSGQTVFIQLHIDLPKEISLLDAHEVSDDVEDLLHDRYPGAEIIIHSDPLGVQERRDNFQEPKA